MKKISLFIGAILFAGAIYGLGNYFGIWKNQNNSIEYKTEKVTKGNIQAAISVDGRVRLNTWKLGFLGTGILDKINVSLGEVVKKGQILAQLDTKTGENKLNQARADFEASVFAGSRLVDGGADYELKKEAYENAKDKLKAEDDLYDEYVDSEGKNSTQALAQKVKVKIAQADVADAKKQMDQIEANYKNASYQAEKDKAAYDQSKNEYGDYQIIAPMEGAIVAQINGVAGDVFSGSQNVATEPLIVLVDEKSFWFEADIEDIDALKIKPEMKAYVKFDSYPEREFAGEVVFVSPVAELDANDIATYRLIVRFDNPEIKLLSDMAGTADLVFEEKRDVMMVSNTAVKEKNGQQTVIIKNENGFVEKVVQTGFTNGKKVEIKSGLSAGEEVIIIK